MADWGTSCITYSASGSAVIFMHSYIFTAFVCVFLLVFSPYFCVFNVFVCVCSEHEFNNNNNNNNCRSKVR